MRDQIRHPSMTNMLNGLTTRHTLYSQYVESGNHQHYLHEGRKSATPYDQYAERANNLNFIFMRDQHSPPPQNISEQYVGWGNNINFIFMSHEGSKLATPSEQYVDCGTSTLGKRPGCSEHVSISIFFRRCSPGAYGALFSSSPSKIDMTAASAAFRGAPRKLAETEEEKKQLESIDKLCEFKEGPLLTIAVHGRPEGGRFNFLIELA